MTLALKQCLYHSGYFIWWNKNPNPLFQSRKTLWLEDNLYDTAQKHSWLKFIMLNFLPTDKQSRRWLGHLCRMWEVRVKFPLCQGKHDPLLPSLARSVPTLYLPSVPGCQAVGARNMLLQNTQLFLGNGRRKQGNVHVRAETHAFVLGK